MEYIRVTKENLEQEHICCAISNTSQCPFNAKYVPVLEAVAKEKGVPFKAIHLQSKSEAQNAPTPITTYAFFRDGEYLTNEQMNDKRFLKVLNE